jgi:hypothetical protein
MDGTTLRLVCAAVAVVFGVLIFLRRRSSKTE